MDGLLPILVFGCCFIGVLGVAVFILANLSSRKEKVNIELIISQLSQQMNLTRLNSKRPHRFGGTHRNYKFYIDKGSTGTISSHNVSLSGAIAINVEVQMKEPKQGYAYCNRGLVSSTTTFDSAFSAKLKYEWLSATAREAMLTFVRKRENLFLEGLPIHPKTIEEEAKVRLQFNLPVSKQITADDVYKTLDELIEVVYVIETTC
jgi:Tfp pilus assembly protein PilV